jgi:hypothetical protein
MAPHQGQSNVRCADGAVVMGSPASRGEPPRTRP